MHKWIMAVLMSVAGLLVVYLLVAEMPEKQDTAKEEVTVEIPEVPVDAVASQEIYKANCVGCHAVDMKGAIGPALADVGSRLTKEQIYTTITHGKRAMPSFEGKLTDEQIVTVATWLSSLK